jgi:hypothetical protein
MDDVTDRIQQKTRLNPDLIKFIAKNKIIAWDRKPKRAYFFSTENSIIYNYHVGSLPQDKTVAD